VDNSRSAAFFLSPGRCGTQWLADALAEHYTDKAEVTHEPLREAYAARKMLRQYDYTVEPARSPELYRHAMHIRHTLKDRLYIETGWTSYATLPWLDKMLDGRLRLVHLVRHPVHVALSLATHNIYGRKDWIEHCIPRPGDPGVDWQKLAESWQQLSMYEKCLHWWTEINLYGLELAERFGADRYLLVRAEDMFNPQHPALATLVEFVGLPYEESVRHVQSKTVDKHQQLRTPPVDWESIRQYPETMALLERFGYQLDSIDSEKISQRYFSQR